jgi:hypothetical protein
MTLAVLSVLLQLVAVPVAWIMMAGILGSGTGTRLGSDGGRWGILRRATGSVPVANQQSTSKVWARRWVGAPPEAAPEFRSDPTRARQLLGV